MTGLPTERLGPHTWAVSTGHVGGKVGVVVGTRGTLIVDAGADPAEGAAVAATAEGLGRGQPIVLLTHGHWDHVRGCAGMTGVETWVHADAWPSARSQLSIAARQLGAVTALPTSTVIEGPWTMDLGGVTVEVIETPGHAPGSVCARVAEDGVLIGGDTVVTAIPPVFTDGHSTLLERTLRRVATLDLGAVVPGHGRVVQGATEVREAVLRRADYIAAMRARVESLFGPWSADEVVAALALGDRTGGPFDADLVPTDDLVVRHERLVRALVGEVGLRPTTGRSGA